MWSVLCELIESHENIPESEDWLEVSSKESTGEAGGVKEVVSQTDEFQWQISEGEANKEFVQVGGRKRQVLEKDKSATTAHCNAAAFEIVMVNKEK
jgi:hypothetical protein